jgi:hypothetical protein
MTTITLVSLNPSGMCCPVTFVGMRIDREGGEAYTSKAKIHLRDCKMQIQVEFNTEVMLN